MRWILSIALLLAPGPATAVTPAPAEDSTWYYEIGGARALSAPANTNVVTTTIGGSATLGLGYSCGKFDPVLGVTNALNRIKTGADRIMDAMVTAATSAIASLPALILQRANPGLYDLFQNALLRAEETVALAIKTCEQMEAEIAEGKNPYDEWVVLSKGTDWKVQMGTEGIDVVEAKETVEGDAGNNGVPWPVSGGSAGGNGQPPVRVIGDTVHAGWNVILGRPATAGGTVASGPTDPRLAQVWASPAEARDWGVQVLGDLEIRTCDGCERSGVPGVGLLPEQEATQVTVRTALGDLVAGVTPPTLENLETVSAPGIAVTRELVEAVRELPAAEQTVALDKLAGEIALARTLEKALLLRRTLLAGRQVPEIAASPATDDIERKLAELDREIDNLLFDTRVRREVVSDTAARLLREVRRRKAQSLSTPITPYQDPQPVDDSGGVTP
ncbi:MAG: integrating conjugative element protein [Gammaproteobacteria bacterium]|nr:integrating conjugative element protein [Gammaproteobacteria bacterium]